MTHSGIPSHRNSTTHHGRLCMKHRLPFPVDLWTAANVLRHFFLVLRANMAASMASQAAARVLRTATSKHILLDKLKVAENSMFLTLQSCPHAAQCGGVTPLSPWFRGSRASVLACVRESWATFNTDITEVILTAAHPSLVMTVIIHFTEHVLFKMIVIRQ